MGIQQPHSNWLICSTTNARLIAVDAVLINLLNPADKEFNEIVLQLIRKGGKKIRPSLFLLSATLGDVYDKDFLYPASALELIHVASLYHDDVIDRADLRRSSPSANNLWGNSNATYAGNYLFSKAISILAGNGEKISQLTCSYVSLLCLGQLKEAENAYNIHVKVEEYIDIIRKKTGSLFELPCILGAMLARANDAVIDALFNYSKELGIAFQLMDDLLDLIGNPQKTGKSLGTDLKEGVYGYATIYALNSKLYGHQLADILLLEDLTEIKIAASIEIILKTGGIEITQTKIKHHIKNALDALQLLPATPAKTSLINLANFVFSRNH